LIAKVCDWMSDHPQLAERLLRVLGPRLRGTNDNVADVIFIDVSGRVAKRLLACWRAPSVELGITSNHEWLHLISISDPIRGCLPDFRSNEPKSLPLTPIHASPHSECLLTC
jgi:hypothetical protein